ncbi:MAG: translation initiation factor IF-2 [Lachnospiraceae bacterium]|nr:translation initiation factor IF-2 [Lachnospiraceae bacterium]
MTIKDKLQSLKIDITKNKDIVDEIKKKLSDAGENVTKITNKLTDKGEKIINDYIAIKPEFKQQKQVTRPRTISRNEDNVVRADHSKVLNGEKESENKKNGESATASQSTTRNAGKGKLIITIGGNASSIKSENASPNGRQLPQSVIEEFKKNKEEERKKQLAAANEKVNADSKKNEEEVASHEKKNQYDNNHTLNKDGQKQNNQNKPNKQNNQNRVNNQNKLNNQNNQNKQSNQQQGKGANRPQNNTTVHVNQGNNKQNKDQSKKTHGNGPKTIFNPNAATIAIGTPSKYQGKKQVGNKYEKNKEQRQREKAQIKDKSNKYSSNLVNSDYENERERGVKKRVGAFIKPVIKDDKPLDDIKSIVIPEVISIKDLAAKLHLQPSIIVKKLFLTGKIVTVNTELTYEEAENIAVEYDILCEKEVKVDVIAELLKEDEEDSTKLVNRPPVVCVMGHVDHGKTSILDAIRNTNVIAKEAGGITQHIGAYQVKIKDRLITFLDTPGHEAFTAMRLRGAKSTDIAILVVAADDGVKPQTIEAINHAKAANVERVKQQLSEYELVPADWGGQTTYCEVSAKQNIGLENLLEMILLTADVMDLKANPDRKARGIVIESLLDKGKGPVARILVQKGTLHVGDYVAMGKSFGKVRAMSDANGVRVDKALPSMPVEILGLNDVPQAGDTFVCFDGEKEARSFAETFVAENKIKLVEESKHKVTLDALFDQIKAGELKELNIVLKADVAGSSEAIKNSLEKLSNDEVVVKVIHEGVGNINESDVTLASASNAIIIGFNVKPEANTKSIIEREKVDLRLYNIIYNAIDDVEKAMKGMLAPVFEEKVIGNVVVRQIFKSSSAGNIAGSFVVDGEVRRNAKVRLKRGDKLLFDGEILSLKRFKDEVKEVKAGFECGIVLSGFNDYAVDDTMEVYVMEEKKIGYED